MTNRSAYSCLCRRRHNHDLRHTCATLALQAGVHPKVVSEMLRHSTVSITLDLYSHVTPTLQKDAVDKLEAALRG
ncbi:MAG TPA: tyrosine-type recombinase/integrase [Thermoleophilia bacterium]|nr:tyrosine-type recombinase/integrase [Thermoleophilia bacterium]